MKNRDKQRLYTRIRDLLYAAGVPIELVHFQGFLRREDSYPTSRRFVLIRLIEIRKKLARASMTMDAVWTETGRYRIFIRDNYMNVSRTATFHQRSNQDFNLNAVAAEIQGQVNHVRDVLAEEEEIENAQVGFEAEAEKIEKTFSLDEVALVEGWNQLSEVVLKAHPDGLTLAFNVRMTPSEVRGILGRARDLGLLPGGVRQKDQTTDPKVRSRFQRV